MDQRPETPVSAVIKHMPIWQVPRLHFVIAPQGPFGVAEVIGYGYLVQDLGLIFLTERDYLYCDSQHIPPIVCFSLLI